MTEFKDYPFDEIVEAATKLIAEGHDVYQKFTCAGCGERLGMDDPNKFHHKGTCDKCGAVTDIKARGCNYLIVIRPLKSGPLDPI